MTNIPEILGPYRKRIDELDDQIVDLLITRTKVIRDVGYLKAEKGIHPVLQDRVEEVRNRCAERVREKDGEEFGLDADLVYDLYTNIIKFSCNLEEKIKASLQK